MLCRIKPTWLIRCRTDSHNMLPFYENSKEKKKEKHKTFHYKLVISLCTRTFLYTFCCFVLGPMEEREFAEEFSFFQTTNFLFFSVEYWYWYRWRTISPIVCRCLTSCADCKLSTMLIFSTASFGLRHRSAFEWWQIRFVRVHGGTISVR